MLVRSERRMTVQNLIRYQKYLIMFSTAMAANVILHAELLFDRTSCNK
mgnify:CR=1 FL=1